MLAITLSGHVFAGNSGPMDDVQLVNGPACCTHVANAADQSVKNNSQVKTVKVTIKTTWTDHTGAAKEKTAVFILAPGEEKKLGCTSNCLYPGNTPSTTYTRQVLSAEYLQSQSN